MTWRALTNRLLSSLFEPPCAACKTVLSHPLDGAVCETCWAAASAMATAARLTSGAYNERFGDERAVDWAAAIGEYEGSLREIIHALKYEGRRSIAPPLGALMRSAGADLLRGADVVVPVPLHPRRERSRGFNQADDLARALGVPVRPLLRRNRYTTSQIELPKDERHRNVHDAFALADKPSAFALGASADKKGLSPHVVVLVDDVSTTGATLDACASVLKAAGAKEVRALTAARVASARR
ncbi:MAG: ComF family protein [Acidobacteriota bacterium]|nr:ComF family protein [Acidobacteriota bacterium]